jgi:hypothetical protein
MSLITCWGHRKAEFLQLGRSESLRPAILDFGTVNRDNGTFAGSCSSFGFCPFEDDF